jgi:hypothetical protein
VSGSAETDLVSRWRTGSIGVDADRSIFARAFPRASNAAIRACMYFFMCAPRDQI